MRTFLFICSQITCLCFEVLKLLLSDSECRRCYELPASYCSGKPMPDLLPVAGLWTPSKAVEAPTESVDLAAPMDVDVSGSLI